MKWLFYFLLLFLLIGCSHDNSPPTKKNVIGLTQSELYEKYPETKTPTGSFSLLISKNLHPYNPPIDHVFLQYGDEYIVFELNEGKVIALHRVSG